jgi:hypothetical protein
LYDIPTFYFLKYLFFIMNKILIINILILMVLPNQLWATIQKAPANAVTLQNVKPKLSLKQKVFTYLIQHKIRRLNAKSPKRDTPKNRLLQECVTIRLTNGRTIWATIVNMDEENIRYKLCDDKDTAEGTVRVEQVANVTDAQNRTIFTNQPKRLKTGALTKGDRHARVSISAFLIAISSIILAILASASFSKGGEDGTQVLILIGAVIIYSIFMIASVIAGVLSWIDMLKTPPQNKNSKIFASVSTIILVLALLLSNLINAGF